MVAIGQVREGVPKPYTVNDKNSFGYDTVTRRVPSIIRDAREALGKAASKASPDAAQEAEQISAQLEKVIEDMRAGARLEPLKGDFPNIDVYNEALRELGPTHYTDGPWLFIECYVYRRLQIFFDGSQNWRKYDMFGSLKRSSFEQSAESVAALASQWVAVEKELPEILKKDKETKFEDLKILFLENIQSSLWGNATDLSLLVDVPHEELNKLQVSVEDRNDKFVLANDSEKIWSHIKAVPGGRIDIVLDNAGFELYTDLILSLYLLDSGLAEQVVIHPKLQPWFVSDVTPEDWIETLNLLRDEKLFPNNRKEIEQVVKRILEYQSEGQIVLRPSLFWTTPAPFWDIYESSPVGGEVYKDLRASKLVIFKGDLNYRKLTGDVKWPSTTPFKEALLQFGSSGIPIASLRTVKGDVVVGIPAGKETELNREWAEHKEKGSWKWSGKYAVISYDGP